MKTISPRMYLPVLLITIVILVGACDQKQPITPATGPDYTYKEWPYEIPARIADSENKDLFIMTLGKVETNLADGVYDPVSDEVTLDNGQKIANYYRDTLGITYYSPIDKSIFPLPPSGLCTWYYYYQDINEQEVKLNTDWISDNLIDYGAKYIQIDDGWQKEKENGKHGSRDWSGIDMAFPSGMANLASYIKEKGLIPGIWIAPHGQSNDSVVMANPGVFIFKPDSTSASITWEGDWLIDPTSEDAHKYLGNLFTEMVDWGYDYFKIDGQPIVVDEYAKTSEFMKVPGKDNELLYRSTLETMREAIGDKRYLLGCWGTPTEGMGLMNGSRTGGDVVLGWSGFDVALMPTMNYYYQHNIAWYTDPDVMLLRQPLTYNQAQVWATLQGLTGQALMSSDRLMDLSDDRIELMRKVYPATDIRPLDLFPSNIRKKIWDLKINHLGRQYDVVGLFNFGEEKLEQIHLDWNEIGLTEDVPYHVFDFWNNEYLGAWEKGMACEVAPTSCRVLTLMPDNGKIRIISTNRHITQGWIDLENFSIDKESNTISGESNVIKNDPYQIHIAYPRGEFYNITKIKAKGDGGQLKSKITNHQTWATATIYPSSTASIEWQIFVEKTDYNYKYITRDPGSVSAEIIGIDGVKLSWRAQYYLNAGYQVYLNDELAAYSPSTNLKLHGLNPTMDYKIDVRTVWTDGAVSKKDENNRNQALSLNLQSLLDHNFDLTKLTESESVDRVFGNSMINGVTYEKSIQSFGSAESDFKIYGLFNNFNAIIGIDDNSFGSGESAMIFKIIGDGKVIYSSAPIKKGQKPTKISVNIRKVETLRLITESTVTNGNRWRGQRALWVNPILVKN